MSRWVLATGRLFGMDGPARIKIAPGVDVVRAHAEALPVRGPRFATEVFAAPVDRAFRIADRKLMALVHESRSRRRG